MSTNNASIHTLKDWCRSQDMVHIELHGQIKNKTMVRKISELLVENLCPKLRRIVQIDVNFVTACEDQVGGFCWGDKSSIQIEVARTSNGHRYSYEEMLINLTHELIHAKQFILGEIKPSLTTWKRRDYSKTPYSQQPWEREAYYWEERLYQKYFKKILDL